MQNFFSNDINLSANNCLTSPLTWIREKGAQFIQGGNSPRRVRRIAAGWLAQSSYGHDACASLQWQTIARVYTTCKHPHSLFPPNTTINNALTKEFPKIVEIEIGLLRKIKSLCSGDLEQISMYDWRRGARTSFDNIDDFEKVLKEIDQAQIPVHSKNKLLASMIKAIYMKPNPINYLEAWQIIASKQRDLSPLLQKLLQRSEAVENGAMNVFDFFSEHEKEEKDSFSRIAASIGPKKLCLDALEEIGLIIPSDYMSARLDGISNPFKRYIVKMLTFEDSWLSPDEWFTHDSYLVQDLLKQAARRAADCVDVNNKRLKIAKDFGFVVDNKWIYHTLKYDMDSRLVDRVIESINFNNSLLKIVKDWGMYVESFFSNKWLINRNEQGRLHIKLLFFAASAAPDDPSCKMLMDCIKQLKYCTVPLKGYSPYMKGKIQEKVEKKVFLSDRFFEVAKALGLVDTSSNWLIPNNVREYIKEEIAFESKVYFEDL